MDCIYCRMPLVWSDLVAAWVDVVLNPARDFCPDSPDGRHRPRPADPRP